VRGRRPSRLELGEDRRDVGDWYRAAQPAKARDEDQLELRDDRSDDAKEQVVEAAVLEVVLDAGAADPTDPAVDDHDLAVIDVADPVEVPAERAAASERPEPSTELGRTHDADLDPRCRQPVVERFRAPFGIGAAAVDDEPDGDALGCLLDQRLGKGFPRRNPA
jgi:hypothetical protein